MPTKYIKDYRRQMDADIPTISFDGKYQYLPVSHPDSRFHPSKLEGILSNNVINLETKFKCTTEEVVLEFDVSYPVAIANLINHGYIFDPLNFCWDLPLNLEINSVDRIERYVITSVVNDCYPHFSYYTLKKYAELHNAEFIVLECPYGKTDDSFTYANFDENLVLPNVQVLNSLKILPTAVNPLMGLDLMCDRTTIIAHPQLALKTLKTADSDFPTELWTTGCCSQANYSETKAGEKAKSLHSYGGLLLEIDLEGVPFIRTLCSDNNGDIYDLGVKYDSKGIVKEKVRSLVRPGDIHVGQTNPSALLGLYDLVNELQPDFVLLDDVFDGSSLNHHTRGKLLEQHNTVFNSVKEELQANYEFLEELECQSVASLIIVPSNHHNFLSRWVEEIDPRTLSKDDLGIYLKAANFKFDNPTKDIYEHFLSTCCEISLLEQSTSLPFRFKNNTILHVHGHEGMGKSLSANSKVPMLVTQEHYHSPSINKGCWTGGTMSNLRLGYNSGFSDWSHRPIIEYPNNVRQIIPLINGKYKP